MRTKYLTPRTIGLFLTLMCACLIVCCTPDKDPPVKPQAPGTSVRVELDKVPYPKLSDYRFFTGDIKLQLPNEKVLPYAIASSLFTDYALKKRFVFLPEGKQATYVSDHEVLDFPVGTALVKTFYYDRVQPGNGTRLLETRVMIRKEAGWIFGTYVWNESQTEAVLQMSGSNVPVQWRQEDGALLQTNYRIPSEVECFTCHKQEEKPIPIGPKPQNMNIDMDDGDGPYNQLLRWIALGYLENNLPASINATVDYNDATQPLAKRIRSYLDINCAHCHQEGSHCDYRPLRLAYSETEVLANMGVCVVPDEEIGAVYKYIVWPARPLNSVMHYRLSATDESVRMPLLGRTLVHEEGVALLKEWINNLSPCN